jgi:hypothetical protein
MEIDRRPSVHAYPFPGQLLLPLLTARPAVGRLVCPWSIGQRQNRIRLPLSTNVNRMLLTSRKADSPQSNIFRQSFLNKNSDLVTLFKPPSCMPDKWPTIVSPQNVENVRDVLQYVAAVNVAALR